MAVYTVHAPAGAAIDPRSATDRFAFARDGFHFWAFIFGPLWLLYHRLWLALIGYVVVAIGAAAALSVLHASSGVRLTVMLLTALLMGFEVSSLRRWTLSRRRWRQIDIIVADDEQAAERRFFDRWTRGQAFDGDRMSVDRGAPPPTRDIPGQPFSRPPPLPHDIVGLFPQPGVPR